MRLYVGGTFDLFHPGHVNLLFHCHGVAQANYGRVIVSLNTDQFAESYKRRPIMTLEERMEVVLACQYVDEVIVNWGGADSRPAILKARATHIVHGDDWTGESLMEQMGFDQAWLDENGARMLYVPYTQGIDTSDLIERCRSRR